MRGGNVRCRSMAKAIDGQEAERTKIARERKRKAERETHTHSETERNREKSSAKRGDEARGRRRHLHCPTGLPDGQQEPRPAGLIQYVFEVPNYF